MCTHVHSSILHASRKAETSQNVHHWNSIRRSHREGASVLPLPGPSHLGGTSSLQSVGAGTPCDVLEAPLEALLLLFLRKVDLRKVNDVVPKVTLLASSSSGPLHQSTPWQDLLPLHKWISHPTFQQDKSTILEPASHLPSHPTAPGCLRFELPVSNNKFPLATCFTSCWCMAETNTVL